MTVGAILVVAGGLLLGLAAAGELAGKAKATEQAIRAVGALEREICSRLAPLPDAVRAAIETVDCPLLDAFARDLEQRGSEDGPGCWQRAVKESGLPPESQQIVSALGEVIGRYSGTDQKKVF